MAKRKSSAVTSNILSPIHPKLHYVLFLILALFLVLIVASVMQKTAVFTRAKLICPQTDADPAKLVEDLSMRCPEGIKLTSDNDGCRVWVCK